MGEFSDLRLAYFNFKFFKVLTLCKYYYIINTKLNKMSFKEET
jgi:hypothetical protein